MSRKYNRTQHLPFSPGKGNDDKVAKDVSSLLGITIVITEKCDGSNASLESEGVFARTHAHTPTHPSFDMLKGLHARIKYDLKLGHQYFGENLFAVHSIKYDALPDYFLLFAIRFDDLWAPWEEVCLEARRLEISTVPLLWAGVAKSAKELEKITTELAAMPSECGGEREGVVVRVASGFADEDFPRCVMKYVRAGHIEAGDDHWKHKEVVKNGLR